MHSLARHRGSSKRCECRFARVTKAVLPRAVRPLAASARPQRFGTGSNHYAEPASGIEEEVCLSVHSLLREPKKPMLGRAKASLVRVTAYSESMQALRRSAKPNARGRAATSFARGGGFGSLAGGVTQRTMHAGSVLLGALPNHSINRTCPGKPGHAGYLKR
jgi:hypothetical protein